MIGWIHPCWEGRGVCRRMNGAWNENVTLVAQLAKAMDGQFLKCVGKISKTIRKSHNNE